MLNEDSYKTIVEVVFKRGEPIALKQSGMDLLHISYIFDKQEKTPLENGKRGTRYLIEIEREPAYLYTDGLTWWTTNCGYFG